MPEPLFPLVALIVSGGHTFLVEMRDHLQYRLLGETVDDAAGEAFDKVGRLLGLPYPGGPAIMKAAAGATRHDVVFPRAWLGDSFDFSFSGLKTAARRTIAGRDRRAMGRRSGRRAARRSRCRAGRRASRSPWWTCSSTKTMRAAARSGRSPWCWAAAWPRTASCAIASPTARREAGIPLVVPRPALCTDNGAMIGAAGARRWEAGVSGGPRPGRPAVAAAGAPVSEPPIPGGRPPAGGRDGTDDDGGAPPLVPAPAARSAGRPPPAARGGAAGPPLAVAELPGRPGRAAVHPRPGRSGAGSQDPGNRAGPRHPDRWAARRRCARSPRSSSIEGWPDRLERTQSDAIGARCPRGWSGATSSTRRSPSLIEAPYEVVANVPYHITSPILHRFLGGPPRPERLVLMLQREVAERISRRARRDELPVRLRPVPRRRPDRLRRARARPSSRPRTWNRPWSRSGRSTRAATRPRLSASDEDDLWRLVQAGFRERRKKLHNVLSRQLSCPARPCSEVLARRAGSTATAGRRRCRWTSGWPCGLPSGDSRDRRSDDDRAPGRPHPRRPLRAGEAEPDPGRGRSTGGRLPRPPLDHGPAVARRCPDGIGGACRRGRTTRFEVTGLATVPGPGQPGPAGHRAPRGPRSRPRGQARRLRLRRWSLDWPSGFRSPPAWAVAAATPPRQSMPLSLPGPRPSIRRRRRRWPHRSARTCRSSWPAARPSSPAAASSSSRCRTSRRATGRSAGVAPVAAGHGRRLQGVSRAARAVATPARLPAEVSERPCRPDAGRPDRGRSSRPSRGTGCGQRPAVGRRLARARSGRPRGGAAETGGSTQSASPARGRRCGRSIRLWRRLARRFGSCAWQRSTACCPPSARGSRSWLRRSIAGRPAPPTAAARPGAARVRSGLARSTIGTTATRPAP